MDRFGVGLLEVGEEAAFGVVAAVDFVEEVDSLQVEGVVGGLYDIGIVLKFLDVDDRDFTASVIVMDGLWGSRVPYW